MKPELLSALSALAGALGGKLLDLLYQMRKGRADDRNADRLWYTTEFEKLRAEITRQDVKIEAQDTKIDTQLATIRKHEATIDAQDRTIGRLQNRVTELEGKNHTIDLNVTMAPQE